MITKEKLSIYEEFGGDVDGWVRKQRTGASGPINDEDWRLIERLLQKLQLVHSNLATSEFAAQTQAELQAAADSDQTSRRMMEIASFRSGTRE